MSLPGSRGGAAALLARPLALDSTSRRPLAALSGAEPAGQPVVALAGSHSATPPTGREGAGWKEMAL